MQDVTLVNSGKIVFSFSDLVKGENPKQYSIDKGTSIKEFLQSIDCPIASENLVVVANGNAVSPSTYIINANDNIMVSSNKQGGGLL